MHSLINHLLLAVLITQLLTGIVLIARNAHPSKHKNRVMYVLSVWVVIMAFYLGDSILHPDVYDPVDFSRNMGFLNFKIILTDYPCFFAMLSYPFLALYPTLLRFRNYMLALSPVLLLCGVYFVWHWVMGVDPFYVYETIDSVWQNITTVPVILRLLMVVLFVAYVAFSLINAWRIIPIYNELAAQRFSQSNYDIRWVRYIIVYYALVSLCLVCELFFTTEYLNTISVILFIVSFFYVIEKTLFNHVFADINKLGLCWTFLGGWQLVKRDSDRIEEIDLDKVALQIDKWMRTTEPYTKVHFTSDDIIEYFPQLNNEDLRKIFKKRGTSLHAYIRDYRIRHACRIIETDGADTNLKEVYSVVGFSHYSSFARAFIQLVEVSPTDYIKQQK